MDISMVLIGEDFVNNSSFDEEDIQEMGVSIGDAIGAAIDEELALPETRSITITINL